LPPCCCCFRPPVLPIKGIIPPLACILPALGVQTCQSLSKSFQGDIACNKHNRNLAKVTQFDRVLKNLNKSHTRNRSKETLK
jgi:hypothetical protein